MPDALLQNLPRSQIKRLGLTRSVDGDLFKIASDIWTSLQNVRNINGQLISCEEMYY